MQRSTYVDPPSTPFPLLMDNPLHQTRWFLCVQDDWRLDDGLFDKEDFFNAIVQLFESDPSDQWCQDTLAWWNS
jgi:hypothetical protein